MIVPCRATTPSLAACVVAVFFIAGNAARAACDFDLQGEGRVAAVTDARSFRLEDGREVRLAGIEVSTQTTDTGVLGDLIRGREVTLHGASDMPDRYGRQQAFVFVDGDDS